MSGPQPEIAVLGPEHVAVVGALGVLEGLVGVADGGVGPPAGPGVQVGPVGFDLGDLVADPGELVGDVGRDQPDAAGPVRRSARRRSCWARATAWARSVIHGLAALLVPGPGEPLGGLARVGGGDIDVAGGAGPAHGHIGQFSSAAVVEDVGDVHGGALAAMGGDGVAVAEALGADVVGSHPQLLAVGGDRGQLLGVRVDGGDLGGLGGDPGAVGVRGPG